jgi:hypothetical protein
MHTQVFHIHEPAIGLMTHDRRARGALQADFTLENIVFMTVVLDEKVLF